MPTIKLDAPTTTDTVRAALTRTCPDLDLRPLGKGLSAAHSRWVAAWIMPQGKRVQIIGNVGSKGMMAALLLILLTGIGLPLYAILVVRKQQALAKRVHAALERELRPSR